MSEILNSTTGAEDASGEAANEKVSGSSPQTPNKQTLKKIIPSRESVQQTSTSSPASGESSGASSSWETDTSANTSVSEPPQERPVQQQEPPTQNTVSNRQQTHQRNNTPFYSREGFFMHYLFINLSVRYSSYLKLTARRLLEFFVLMNAIAMLAVLIYIHVTFIKCSNDCLNHVKDIWPKTGIIRVQLSRNASLPRYKMYFMDEPFSNSLSVEMTPFNTNLHFSTPVSHSDIVSFTSSLSSPPLTNNHVCPNNKVLNPLMYFLHLMKANVNMTPVLRDGYISKTKQSFVEKLKSMMPDITVEYKNKMNTVNIVNQELLYYGSHETKYDPFEPNPIRDFYAIEYSEEFGFLRLSLESRNKLAIPTLVVNLNPDRDLCFAGFFKKFLLSTFLGYDDYIMTSIKKLAEKENSQGYLHNLVTGEYFRFVSMWISQASWAIAFLAMVVFTLAVTMLLRYSYHQIFVFMVGLLRLLDTDTRLMFPAAPMLTIILALVGMEEIMTEFFHDSTVAFYVILLLWGADQFDIICLHTTVSRRHWVRFFFLYHFSFYIYHYRFNGQYSKLALFTSWLFILHSMLYFLHHYELPSIQNQILIIQERNATQNQPNNNNDSGGNNTPNPGGNSNINSSRSPSSIVNSFPNPLDENIYLDDNNARFPQPNNLREQLHLTLFFFHHKTTAKLAATFREIFKKVSAFFKVCKCDILKMCIFVCVSIVAFTCTALLIHLKLSRMSHPYLELQKIENYV